MTARKAFLLGASRSGTTLLRLMLNQHPEVFAPSEARFLSELLDEFPPATPLDPEMVHACVSRIVASPSWAWWRTPDDEVAAACASLKQPTVPELLDAVFSHLAERAGKALWIEKTPAHCFYARRLVKLYPEARFVHLVRDGRGSCCSMVRRGWYGGSIRRAAQHWRGCVEEVRAASAESPSKFLLVHFEELIRQPEPCLRAVCAHIGVPYHPGMVEHRRDLDRHLGRTEIHEKVEAGLDPGEAERWKQDMALWELLVFESLAADTNAAFGYGPAVTGPTRLLLGPVRGVVTAQRFASILASKLPVRRHEPGPSGDTVRRSGQPCGQ